MYVVKITDGLGNQMFQYAFARWIYKKTGKKVYLDISDINNTNETNTNKHLLKKNNIRKYELNYFNISLPVIDSKKVGILRHFLKYVDEDNQKIEDNLVIPSYFKGYFFDLRYLDETKNLLKKEFVLKNKIKIPQDIKKILKSDNTVSIHVRRGDFLKLNRDISSSNYYSKAIDYILKQVDNPTFLVFSDEIEWVKNNMLLPSNTIYISSMGFEDYEELAIMKHCKHNIIANSTFSYWAAYLNSNKDKIVIYPKNWRKSIIPDEWIGV